ncbi:hypothetical protein [Gordonia insulae]|uniref:Uncharacterized protein n=1 Tax=Gordonia insulae TaxID=2420509 RepID=A0A3G8JHR2_9ACTN|nr:hypothetical protein [Gordonia insulae]AZG43780.1 hypothetical protein D7316_00349 [Gordonia insulae]
MTSAQPPRPDGPPLMNPHDGPAESTSTTPPVGPFTGAAPAAPPPQYWLRSGPMLPQRTWQRTTRSPVILVSALAAMALAAVAVVALVVGSINASAFTARGVILCPTAPGLALQVGPGAPVQIFDETGDELSATTLGPRRSGDAGRCEMQFRARDVPSGRAGYVVRVGNVFQETVSESALTSGAVLRPLG